LFGTDSIAIEGDIIINRIRVSDQTIVRDHLNSCGSGCIRSSSGSSSILRTNYQNLDPLGNQGFNVGFFLGRITLAEKNLGFITSL